MKNTFIKVSLLLIVAVFLSSCGGSESNSQVNTSVADSTKKLKQQILPGSQMSDAVGIVGIFDVPEMLTISKLDSCKMTDVSFRIAKNYAVLEEEMNTSGAELDGTPGMITYNNDTSNFVFECVLPIKSVPKKQPKLCKIVALEATPMLIYNFYGPVQHLFSAYDKIRKYMIANKLMQSGPMREFYLFDPTIEKDPTKWQTRIMVPIGKTI